MKAIFSSLALFVCCVLLTLSNALATCTLVPIPIAERASASDLIVQGAILEKKSAWDSERHNIYTKYTLLAKFYFGNAPVSRVIEFYVAGGQVGEVIHQLQPSFEIPVPSYGLLFLKKMPHMIGNEEVTFTPYAYRQGFVEYDLNANHPKDVFYPFKSIEELESQLPTKAQIISAGTKIPLSIQDRWDVFTDSVIRNIPTQPIKGFKNTKKEDFKTFAGNISFFTPSTVNGGIGDLVTINGWGFESYGGRSAIALPNADNGGGSMVNVPASDILSWSDNRISFRVPAGVGSGRIRITTNSGQSIISGSILTVNYSIINYQSWTINGTVIGTADWYNRNGSGGYTFTYNQSFFQNSSAIQSFQRAVESWRCNTLCNLSISTQTSTRNCSADDGINLVSFMGNCGGNWDGVLAVTFNRAYVCYSGSTALFQIREFDMLFGTQWSWNYGPSPTSFSQTDFESVALHELGHCLQHGHVIDNSKIMHYAIGRGMDKRVLDAGSSVAGANWVLARSNSRQSCGNGSHISIASNACRLNGNTGVAPTPNFSVNQTSGCSPLTVTFTDMSTGNPTSWQWDVDGNGTIDYTTRNCSHTYTVAGNYNVRLTVSNAFGMNQTVRVGLINVTPNNVNLTVSPNAPAVCANNPVTLTALGADSYTWFAPNGVISNNATCNFTPSQTTTLTVTGFRNGCSATRLITVSVLSPINISTTLTNPTNNFNNGSISISANNGLAPYRYKINNGTYQNSNVFSNLFAGTYTIGVMDAANCFQSTTVTLINNNSGSNNSGTVCSNAVTPRLTVGSVSANSAVISWNALTGVSRYVVMYRASGGGWLDQVTTQTTVTLSNLLPNTSYEAYVRAECVAGSQTPYSNAGTFQTLSNTSGGNTNTSCALPLGVNIQPGTNQISLTWSSITNATGYRVFWRVRGTSGWLSVMIFTNNLTISSLVSNTNYEIQLQTVCGSSSSDFSTIYNARTLSGRDADRWSENTVNVYPNPTNGFINISGLTEESHLTLTDLAGKTLLSTTITESNINLSAYSKGIYLLILNNTNANYFFKIIIE